MRLHWISLLPPLEVSTARAAVQALHALAEVCELTIWTVQEPWDPALARCGTLRPLSGELWRETNRGEPLVALVGEEPENAVVLQLVRQHADVVLLHGRRFDPPLRALDGDGAAAGRSRAEALAGCAASVVCHVEGALAGERPPAGGRIVDRPPPWAPDVPWRCDGWSGSRRWRLLVQPGPPHLVTALLAAVESLAASDRPEVVFAAPPAGPPGRPEGGGLCRWEAAPFHELAADVERFDVAVLLASGSAPSADQLTAWSRASPTLAPASGWHRDRPLGTFAPLGPGREMGDLAGHLRELRRHPEDARALGEAGLRHLVARHSPERWRELVLDLAADALAAGPAAALRPLAARVDAELFRWALPGAASSLGGRARDELSRLFAAARLTVAQEPD